MLYLPLYPKPGADLCSVPYEYLFVMTKHKWCNQCWRQRSLQKLPSFFAPCPESERNEKRHSRREAKKDGYFRRLEETKPFVNSLEDLNRFIFYESGWKSTRADWSVREFHTNENQLKLSDSFRHSLNLSNYSGHFFSTQFFRAAA